jgi:hypothetical protein
VLYELKDRVGKLFPRMPREDTGRTRR